MCRDSYTFIHSISGILDMNVCWNHVFTTLSKRTCTFVVVSYPLWCLICVFFFYFKLQNHHFFVYVEFVVWSQHLKNHQTKIRQKCWELKLGSFHATLISFSKHVWSYWLSYIQISQKFLLNFARIEKKKKHLFVALHFFP